MQKKFSPLLLAGLLANSFSILLNRFFILPEFLAGLLSGTSIAFLLLGALSQQRLQALRRWKHNLFKQ